MTLPTASLVRKMSLVEFLAADEDETGLKCELEYGEIIELMRPTFEHNELSGILFGTLYMHIRANDLGRLSQDIIVVLDKDRELAYAPDLVFVAAEHLHRIRDGRVYGAPDLVVEILSPSTASRDHLTKLDAYLKNGIPWYWIADPQGPGIEEYRATEGGYLRTATAASNDIFQPGIFPGLNIDLATLVP